jgi:hypothetical protein
MFHNMAFIFAKKISKKNKKDKHKNSIFAKIQM